MRNAGIWLDQKQANIIVLWDNSVTTRTILSGIDTRQRIPGETKQFGRFGDQYLTKETTQKNKIDNQTVKYLDTIIEALKNIDSFIIFGPAEAKIKLKNQLQNYPKIATGLKEVLTEENITENQKIAFVKNYFKNL